jgi:hypothetical protein
MEYQIEVANFTSFEEVMFSEYNGPYKRKKKNHVGNHGQFKITADVISDHDGALVKTCVSTHRSYASAEKKLKSLMKSVH